MPFDPFSAGASVVGGLIGGIGSHAASQAQQDAINKAGRMDRSNYLAGLQLNDPARSIGYQAYGDIANEFGYTQPAYTTNNQLMATMNPLTSKDISKMLKHGSSYDQIASMGTQQQPQGGQPPGQPAQGHGFMESPDYQFRRNEGQRDIGNSFAARGGAASGNALKALSEFNGNLASGEFGNWFNRRMALAGRGDQAVSNVQQGGQNYTQQYGGNQQQLGDSRASGILGVTGAIQGGLSGVAGSFGQGGNSFFQSGGFNPNGYGGTAIAPQNYGGVKMPQYNFGG